MIDKEIPISISERSSCWAINYLIIGTNQVEEPSSSDFSQLVAQCRETFLRNVILCVSFCIFVWILEQNNFLNWPPNALSGVCLFAFVSLFLFCFCISACFSAFVSLSVYLLFDFGAKLFSLLVTQFRGNFLRNVIFLA